MREHPFVTLCGADRNGRPVATQVPVFVDEREGQLVLTGHMMRNTDHHLAFRDDNPEVLALFTGPHAYVSASWYTKPEQASTWNYMTVHARGMINFLSREGLMQVLKRTTDHYEHEGSAASFDALDTAYVERLAGAIEAFEILVSEVDHVFKLSQNRDEASHHNIIDQLSAGDELSRAVAEEMKQDAGSRDQPMSE
jgi:transcriptional regulator